MDTFSKRYGYVKDQIQTKELKRETRNRLWNLLENYFSGIKHKYDDNLKESTYQYPKLLDIIIDKNLKRPLDDFVDPYQKKEAIKKFVISEAKFYEVFDLIENIFKSLTKYLQIFKNTSVQQFTTELNSLFIEENVGYRVVNGKIIPITNEEEIKEIEKAIYQSRLCELKGPAEHLENALALLAKRPDPDYQNSIKEAISAVESCFNQILKKKYSGLKDSLNNFETKAGNFHPALKEGFLKLYGYTSDAGGIRHGIFEDQQEITLEDARFFLISCSAFVNYIIEKSRKKGLLK